MPTCRTRVLAGGRCTLHEKVLAHASDRVNPDAFGDGSGQERRTAPFRRGAGTLKADIDEQIYIEIPDEFQKFPGTVGWLNKVSYGLVQAGRCWNSKFYDDMTSIGSEQENRIRVCSARSLTVRRRWWWSYT